MKNSTIAILFILSSVLSFGSFAHVKKTSIPIASMSKFEDVSASMRINDVLSLKQSEWQAIPINEVSNFGYSKSAYWLKVTFTQPLEDCCILTVSYTPLDYLDFYQVIDGNRLVHQQSGDRYAFDVRPFHDRHNTFRITHASDGPTVFYLRVQSESILQLPLDYYTDIEFAQTLGQENFFLGLFYGGLLLIAVYNACVFFRLRDKVYAYYLFFVISAALSAACWDGLAFHYLWSNAPDWASRSIPITTGLLTFCTLLFSQELLQIRKNMPWANISIELTKAVSVLLIIMTYIVSYSTVGQLSFAVSIGSGVIGMLVGIAALYKKIEGSGLYLVAWSLLFIGVSMNSMVNIGLIHDSALTNYLIHLGGVIEVCLFSVALANRIKLLKQDKQDAETRMSIERQIAQDKANTLAIISHELRTPMNAVLGFVYLAKQGKGQLSTQDYLEKIEQASSNLVKIINDSLDFSKLEQKKLSLKCEPFNLIDVVDHVTSVSTPGLAGKPVQMHIQVAPDVPFHLLGDRVRLEQVIINLTNNAIKHTDQGHVGVGISVVRKFSHKVVLAFRISDSGRGISQQSRDRLFKPYSQLDEHHKGTGLGLSISQKIIHLMGGQIKCSSEVGQGSLFSFELSFPLINLPERPSESAHVLLVCENTLFGENTELTLRWLGMECDLVSASKALEMTCNYDLILVDQALGGISGETFIDILKTTDLSDIPVAILCNIDEVDGVDGNVFRLSKPIRVSDVLQLVSKMNGNVVDKQSTVSDTDYALSGLHVLVADDNKLNREFISDMLAMFGADVDVVENGQQVLDTLSNYHYHVLLLDLHMPEVDGIECATAIRQKPELSDLSIICTSASPGAISQHLDVFEDCIAKPIMANQLLKLLSPYCHDIAHDKKRHTKGEIRWPLEESTLFIEGIDMALLLDQCAHCELKVNDRLAIFSDMAMSFLRDLSDTQNENTRDLQRIYHDFAGTAGAIGAVDLQNMALSLDSSLQDGRFDNNLSEELSKQTAEMVARIQDSSISSTVV
ncbi:response regulator [Vibrio sp. S9_S30]|uniref:hybrid sensor histidine kinase/response regulator n=1 Tax=Vibrio sp. S9_S30 TaxID=2720226 RepID=UPI0016812E9E|nr:hybrid sensor histidine kinase/response regulator [Vibrio sp. S9_S30]MBD1555794.1 response regulator [Vibrio sp. S9_S30]